MLSKVQKILFGIATTVVLIALALLLSPVAIRAGIVAAVALTIDVWILQAVLLGQEPRVFGKSIPGLSFLLSIILSEASPLTLQLVKSVVIAFGTALGVTEVWWFTEIGIAVFVGGASLNALSYLWGAYQSMNCANLSVSQFSEDGPLCDLDGEHSLSNPLLLILRRTLLLPIRWPHQYKISVLKDIRYATEQEEADAGPVHRQDLRLDIYRPLDRSGKRVVPLGELELEVDSRQGGEGGRLRPVLVYVHGGAWKKGFGSKANLVAQPLYMAELGWVTVSIDYRLAPAHHWPTFIIDCKRALRWVKANIRRYGGNPDFIILAGGSAGGHLASLLAISGPRAHTATANQHCATWQPGFEEAELAVQGCVVWYPACDTSGEWWKALTGRPFDAAAHKEASPQHLLENLLALPRGEALDTRLCPFYVITGAADVLCPKEYMSRFYRTLKEVSLRSAHPVRMVEYLEFPGAHHAFDQIMSPRTLYANAAATRFCKHVYENWQRERKDGAAKSDTESTAGSCSTTTSEGVELGGEVREGAITGSLGKSTNAFFEEPWFVAAVTVVAVALLVR